MKRTHRLAPDYKLEYQGKRGDLDFWIKLVKDFKANSILELGVGIGRVLFPLVKALDRQVKKAVGLDIDNNLLVQAQSKLKREYPKIEAKIDLVRADMRSFELKDKFDFIFISFNTFSLIYKLEDRLAVLKRIKKHLKPAGYFAFEVYAADLEKLTQKLKQRRTQKEFIDKQKGIRLARIRIAKYHPASQIIDNKYIFKKYKVGTGKLIDEYSTTFKLYKFFPTELGLMLKMAGFSMIHFWGDYSRSEFTDDSGKMIIVAK